MASPASADEEEAMEDLSYVQKNSQRRQWTVLRLQRLPDSSSEAVATPAAFERALTRQICLYFSDADVCVVTYHKAFWVRIAIGSPKRGRATYLVHPPDTNYLVVANMKASHTKNLTQALLTALHSHRLEQLHLHGRHIPSLLELVLNKHTRGGYAKYRDAASGEQPENLRKRKRSEETEDFDVNIVHENLEEQKKKAEHLEENFGPYAQPKLEKVEYTLETKFKGLQYAPGMADADVFKCRVKFEGTSVIEGIRNLAKAGLAQMPMKEHLACLHTMARNSFVLRQKPSSSASASQSNSSASQQQSPS